MDSKYTHFNISKLSILCTLDSVEIESDSVGWFTELCATTSLASIITPFKSFPLSIELNEKWNIN